MRFGITGNAGKDSLWKALTDVIRILDQSGYAYVLHRDMAEMLATHGMAPSEETVAASNSAFLAAADIILSFGGAGTLLNTVAAIGQASQPIL
ncbi:MAG: NAD(+)/NADH kinase, partial [Rhodothermales bacterium]